MDNKTSSTQTITKRMFLRFIKIPNKPIRKIKSGTNKTVKKFIVYFDRKQKFL